MGKRASYEGPEAVVPPAQPPSNAVESKPAAPPHAGIDIGIVCNGFDHHPEGDELRRYCVSCLVEADREYEDEPLATIKISDFLKAKFEERYGLYWHCSAGNYKQEYYRDFCDLKRDL